MKAPGRTRPSSGSRGVMESPGLLGLHRHAWATLNNPKP